MARRKKGERTGPEFREYKLRQPEGSQRSVFLAPGDFTRLAQAAGPPKSVKDHEKDYAELVRLGLVRFAFEHDRGGWPYPVVRLTPAGAEALSQEHAPA